MARWSAWESEHEAAAVPAVIEPETFGTADEEAPTQVWTPTAHAMRGQELPPFALRELEDGSLAMLVYTSPEAFADGCGTEQPYLALAAEGIQAFQHALGANVVLWDAVLDPALHQQGEYLSDEEAQ